MLHRRLIVAAALLVAACAFAPFPVRADGNVDDSKKFIASLADEAISKLTVKGISDKEREDRFREIVRKHIDFDTTARWVLGRQYWSKADEKQQKQYLQLFEDLMVATYANRFGDYAGEKLQIKAARTIDDTDSLVQTSLMRPEADKPINVDWVVRNNKSKMTIIDIMIEGLSLAQTKRSEFTSFLRNHNGDIDALIKDLQTRLDDVRKSKHS